MQILFRRRFQLLLLAAWLALAQTAGAAESGLATEEPISGATALLDRAGKLGRITGFGGLTLACIALSGGILSRPAYFRRWVGPATPESLAAIRIWTCGIALAVVLTDSLPSTALLPREMLHPLGVMRGFLYLPGVRAFLASGPALTAFVALTAGLLVLGLVGRWTRWALPAAAVCYLIVQGIPRQYTWFNHAGLTPFFILAVLAFAPCADAWSLDRRARMRQGLPVAPAGTPAAVYGWSRYTCWMVLALLYTACGISKLLNGGWLWWSGLNLRSYVYQETLTSLNPAWQFGLTLTDVPDVLFAALGLVTLAGEALFFLTLFFPWARVVFPLSMLAMHVGILFMQHILFFDSILLLGIFANLEAVARWVLTRLGRRQPQNGAPVLSAPVASEVRTAPFPWLTAGLAGVFLAVSLCRLEYFPLTSMQMFSTRRTTGVVTYHLLLAEDEQGRVVRPAPSRWIGALTNLRARRLLFHLFDGERRGEAELFLARCQQLSRQEKRPLRALWIEKRSWDFLRAPDDPARGQPVGALRYPAERAGPSDSDTLPAKSGSEGRE